MPDYGRFDRIVYFSKDKSFTSKSIQKLGEEPIATITTKVMYPSDHKGMYRVNFGRCPGSPKETDWNRNMPRTGVLGRIPQQIS